eukprot:5146-Heterococcus_DN1.PRE.3
MKVRLTRERQQVYWSNAAGLPALAMLPVFAQTHIHKQNHVTGISSAVMHAAPCTYTAYAQPTASNLLLYCYKTVDQPLYNRCILVWYVRTSAADTPPVPTHCTRAPHSVCCSSQWQRSQRPVSSSLTSALRAVECIAATPSSSDSSSGSTKRSARCQQ